MGAFQIYEEMYSLCIFDNEPMINLEFNATLNAMFKILPKEDMMTVLNIRHLNIDKLLIRPTLENIASNFSREGYNESDVVDYLSELYKQLDMPYGQEENITYLFSALHVKGKNKDIRISDIIDLPVEQIGFSYPDEMFSPLINFSKVNDDETQIESVNESNFYGAIYRSYDLGNMTVHMSYFDDNDHHDKIEHAILFMVCDDVDILKKSYIGIIKSIDDNLELYDNEPRETFCRKLMTDAELNLRGYMNNKFNVPIKIEGIPFSKEMLLEHYVRCHYNGPLKL